ncbi:AraC family transcriptional regulator [Parabacteroides sp. Marseille-P3160]|uniref:AraC family transcriptional regulator n=1 Tax=Parabacteroides sp. Marseille-P3160 TaxID=1917887 RepID=UPI0009BA00F3|nr:AraC family transcriptional regulator [Parabacteroides sp. Marseille-P3160]
MIILERKIIHDRTTLCSHILYPQFVLPRHKHAEYEIMLFTRGSGRQFVGEGVADFEEGDIALIGSNVPHLHLCNTKLDSSAKTEPSGGEALQFHPTIFPIHLENIPDYQQINLLLQKSQYGLRFYEKGLCKKLKRMFQEMDHLEYTSRLIGLLQILDRLFQCKRIELLSETAYNSSNLLSDVNEPINKVYTYLFNHFKEKITLKEVADYVKQNPSALCRYFKQRTDKTIFQCLAEIRLEHACKLLSYSNLGISQIAYESGYNNVPYFIMQFEKKIKRKPSEYRMQLKL